MPRAQRARAALIRFLPRASGSIVVAPKGPARLQNRHTSGIAWARRFIVNKMLIPQISRLGKGTMFLREGQKRDVHRIALRNRPGPPQSILGLVNKLP